MSWPQRMNSTARLWVVRWGFATLVIAAVLISALIGATVAVPSDVPAVALQAAPVYRLEVAAAIFVGHYVFAMAVALALPSGRRIGGSAWR